MSERINGPLLIFTFTTLLLSLFYGFHILIGVYSSITQDGIDYQGYSFVGGMPTTWQILVIGFTNPYVIIESAIISSIVTVLLYFIKMETNAPFASALKWTLVTTFVYSLFKFLPALDSNPNYLDTLFEEVWGEILLLVVTFFVFSAVAIGVISMLKKYVTSVGSKR